MKRRLTEWKKKLACVTRIHHACGVATFVQAVNRFSEAMGYSRAKMALVGRTLREKDGSLVPRDPIGRNKATHLTPTPLWNLMIGTAAADPIANAPQLVRAYRQAGYHPPVDDMLGGKPNRPPILPGQNLGLDGESLINFLAIPSEQERLIRQAFRDDFRITLTVGEALIATVERPAHEMVDYYDAKGFGGDDLPRPTFQLRGEARYVQPLRRIVQLNFSYFEVAAELWADSLSHGTSYQPSLLDPPSGGSENETAADRPLPGTDAAALSNQTAQTELGDLQPHTTGERKKSQPSSKAQSGRFHMWSDPHARHRPADHRSVAA